MTTHYYRLDKNGRTGGLASNCTGRTLTVVAVHGDLSNPTTAADLSVEKYLAVELKKGSNQAYAH